MDGLIDVRKGRPSDDDLDRGRDFTLLICLHSSWLSAPCETNQRKFGKTHRDYPRNRSLTRTFSFSTRVQSLNLIEKQLVSSKHSKFGCHFNHWTFPLSIFPGKLGKISARRKRSKANILWQVALPLSCSKQTHARPLMMSSHVSGEERISEFIFGGRVSYFSFARVREWALQMFSSFVRARICFRDNRSIKINWKSSPRQMESCRRAATLRRLSIASPEGDQDGLPPHLHSYRRESDDKKKHFTFADETSSLWGGGEPVFGLEKLSRGFFISQSMFDFDLWTF